MSVLLFYWWGFDFLPYKSPFTASNFIEKMAQTLALSLQIREYTFTS